MKLLSTLATVLAATAVVTSAAAAPSPSRSAGAPPSPDATLLRAYQPVLVFHPDEPLRPTKVQSFIEDSELEQFVGTTLAQLPLDAFWTVIDADPEPGALPGPSQTSFFRLDQVDCEADAPLADSACYADAWRAGSGGAAVYGRVVRTPTRIVLQYWLFYYDNPLLLPATPVGTFWQSHEGDWELVNVVLSVDEEPLEAAYSQHCTGQRLAWPAVQKADAGSTHPIAYVALGSHANFFAPGLGPLGTVPIPTGCFPPALAAVLPSLPFLQVVDQVLDGTAAGAVVGPPGSGFAPATIHGIEGAPWSTFGGRWGESEYFFTPVPLGPIPAGAVPVGLAPASPPHQANWNVETILGWPLGS